MSKDIRSYFTSASVSKTVSNATKPAFKTKKRRVLSSDEEDEKPDSPVKSSKKIKREPDNESVKMVSPATMFSKAPIKRQEAPKVVKAVKKMETEIFKNAEFEAALSELDIPEESIQDLPEEKRKTPTKKSPPSKQDNHSIKKQKKSSAGSVGNELVVEKTKNKEGHKDEHDVYQERAEKKRQHLEAYKQYLQRGGARNPGSKEIPVGAECCLAGLSFLVTGVLDSMEREEADELIKKYGGRILHTVSKKTDYIVVGDEPGPAKLQKAKSLNIKQISEDDLLELIRTRPPGKADSIKQSQPKLKAKQQSHQSVNLDESSSLIEAADDIVVSEFKLKQHSASISSSEAPSNTSKSIVESDLTTPPTKSVNETGLYVEPSTSPTKSRDIVQRSSVKETTFSSTQEPAESVEALVEKYRPKSMKQILGQHGDKSCAQKLYNWLRNWHQNQNGHVKHAKPSPWAKNDNGAFFKAALLSGPPGIGKTTTVQVVCKELGFDLIEFNASDTRSKKLLQEQVSELLSNTTLKGYFSVSKAKPSSNRVLLMDEVDGMAGNEDRGGLQELIALIKNSEVPIVCICNDRGHTKMRTLSNYTFDLRFQKPRLEQIRGAMKSICFKEQIDITTADLDRLIESTNSDIRQVINHLALHTQKSYQKEDGKKKAPKDLRLVVWDVVKKVFSPEDNKNMTIHQKSDLFFHDYTSTALFVQENYLHVQPHIPKHQILNHVAQAADSLAMGDVVENVIRGSNRWYLLPLQACYSSVIPGSLLPGHFAGSVNFPAWLGRRSKSNKFERLLQEITMHTGIKTGASKEAVNLDYLNQLRNNICRPLITDGTEGIDAAIDFMNNYHLLREDLDSIIEVSLWPGQRDPMQSIDSKAKAAFTRAYNKRAALLPYAVNTTVKKRAGQSSLEDDFGQEEDEEINSSDEDNVETDKMIKAKKPAAPKKAETKNKNVEKAAPKRGKGRGRGK